MIKRQFYKQDHDNDKDDISDSSSDSESEEEVSEAQEEEEHEEDEDSDVVAEAKEDDQPFSLSTGSGYNSEESLVDFWCCLSKIFRLDFWCSLQATFDCPQKTYGFLTLDFWKETRFTKSPFQEYTDMLAKPTKAITLEEAGA